jgi:shikimate dehydrogenase
VGKNDEARLFGVLGDPVDHSLSPAMHNAAFAACGLPHLYLRFRVPTDSLGEALAEARRLEMGGLNLTVPLKEAAVSLVDEVTPEARRIGAVNTIVFDRGHALGDNTDARGFLRALEGRVALDGAHVAIVGAGGSARAVGTALATAGCRRMTIANRTASRAALLARTLEELGDVQTTVINLDALADGIGLDDVRLVVNTTSVGLGADTIAIRHGATPPGCVFMDLVYGQQASAFLRAAARARRPTIDGAGMLLHQGAIAFERWTGRPAPLDAMRRALGRAGLSTAAMAAGNAKGR